MRSSRRASSSAASSSRPASAATRASSLRVLFSSRAAHLLICTPARPLSVPLRHAALGNTCILAVTRAPSGRGAGATPLGSAAASALLAGCAAASAATHLLPCRIAFAPPHHPPTWGHPPHCSGQTDTAIPSRKVRCLAQKRWRQSGRYEICSQAYLSWGAASTKPSSAKPPPTSPAPSPRARSTTTASPTPPDPLTRTPWPSGASVRARAVPEGCNWAASSATAATAPPRNSWLGRGCQFSRFVAGCYGSPAFTRVGSDSPPAQAPAGAPCLAPKRR